jgi:hypothetical protein
MEIYPHAGSTYFSDSRNNYTERGSTKTILILDSSVDTDVFNVDEHGLNDIISKDKVYVSKHSSFSPLLLSRIEGIDVSRVINPEKATKIVLDETVFSQYDDNLFYGEFTSSDENLPTIRGLFRQLSDYSTGSMVRVRHPVEKEIIKDTSSYSVSGQCRPCVIINTDFEVASMILAYPKKIVVTSKLEDYINNFLPELDRETLNSCLDMLGSSDMNAVKLGINMLATFNIKDYTIPISLSIRNNINNLFSIKSLTAFKRICSLCGISINDIRNVPLLDFNIQIYRNSSNMEHRSLIKDNIAQAIRNDITAKFSHYFDEVGLDFAISTK